MSKFLKFFIIFLYLALLVFCNPEIPQEEEEEELNPQQQYTMNLVKEMGFDKPGIIKRNDFEIFLTKLMTQGMQLPEKDQPFYTSLVKKIAESVPEEFESKDLNSYLNPESFQKIFQDSVRTSYGEGVLNELDKKDVLKDAIKSQMNDEM